MSNQRAFSTALSLVVCALLATPCFPQTEARRADAGRLVEFKLSSQALKGNLLGDPAEQSVAVYRHSMQISRIRSVRDEWKRMIKLTLDGGRRCRFTWLMKTNRIF